MEKQDRILDSSNRTAARKTSFLKAFLFLSIILLILAILEGFLFVYQFEDTTEL
jgi:hypothetical protein